MLCSAATDSCCVSSDLRYYFSKVVVLASHWGDEYYHFVTEGLPRVMPVLDVLLAHRDIKVRFACYRSGKGWWYAARHVTIDSSRKTGALLLLIL